MSPLKAKRALRRKQLAKKQLSTRFFYDDLENRQVYIGAMPANQFRQVMNELFAGQ